MEPEETSTLEKRALGSGSTLSTQHLLQADEERHSCLEEVRAELGNPVITAILKP